MLKGKFLSKNFFKVGKYLFLNNSIILFNQQKNHYKIAKVGFSLTTLLSIFIGLWIVPFFRRDYTTMIYLVIFVFLTMSLQQLDFFIKPFVFSIVFFVAILVFAFYYNKIFFNKLLARQYDIFSINYLLDPNYIKKLLDPKQVNVQVKNEVCSKDLEKSLICEMYTRLLTTTVIYIIYLSLLVILFIYSKHHNV